MSDLRFDPVAHRWVAIARNRQERPMEFVPIEQTRKQLICPFCKGNEDETPNSIAAWRSDGTVLSADDKPTSWTARVIPNKYPSLPSKPDFLSKPAHTETGPYGADHSPGRQELIVSSPRHVTSLSQLNDDELHVSFLACQERIRDHQSVGNIEHSMLFMNCRASAGASLSHVHTQLIGAPIISDHLAARRQRNLDHFEKNRKTLMHDLADWERDQETRLIQDSKFFTVFCPFASQFPFQVWIVPKYASERFTDCPPEMRNELAHVCRDIVSQMEAMLDEPGYNLLLHQAPFSMSENDHWYFELFPRLTRPAGFEWGTGIWVNPVSPEASAKQYRVN